MAPGRLPHTLLSRAAHALEKRHSFILSLREASSAAATSALKHLQRRQNVTVTAEDMERAKDYVIVIAEDLTSGNRTLLELMVEARMLEERGKVVLVGGEEVSLASFLAIAISVILSLALVIVIVLVIRRRPKVSSTTSQNLPSSNHARKRSNGTATTERGTKFRWMRNLSTGRFSARADSTTLPAGNYAEIGSKSMPELSILPPENNGKIEDVWKNIDDKDIERGLGIAGSLTPSARSILTKSRESEWEASVLNYRPSTAPALNPPAANGFLSAIQEPGFSSRPVYNPPSGLAGVSPLRISKTGVPMPIEENLKNLKYEGTLLTLSVANASLETSNSDDIFNRRAKIIPQQQNNAQILVSTTRPIDTRTSSEGRRQSTESVSPSSPTLFPLRAPPKSPAAQLRGPPQFPPPTSPLPSPPMSPGLSIPQLESRLAGPNFESRFHNLEISPPELVLPPTIFTPAPIQTESPTSPTTTAPSRPSGKRLAKRKSQRKVSNGSEANGFGRGRESRKGSIVPVSDREESVKASSQSGHTKADSIASEAVSRWDDSSEDERSSSRVRRKGTIRRGKS